MSDDGATAPAVGSASGGASGEAGTGSPDPVLEATVELGLKAALLEAGVPAEMVEVAEADGTLPLVAIEHLAMPDPLVLDLAGLEAATGMPAAGLAQIWRALGFPEPRPGEQIFTAGDADLLRDVAEVMRRGAVEPELAVQMARVIGSSLARVASALVETVQPEAELPMDAHRLAREDLLLYPRIMDHVWRRHLQAAARQRVVRANAGLDPDRKVVGFADLVGFTALSQQVSSRELAVMVDRFEMIAYDAVAQLGGRVVKMIGDEVMFATDDERSAAEIALTLAETYGHDEELSDVRVGLAAGEVLQREADLFGPVVNLASRIVGIAFPGSVVVPDDVHDALAEDSAYGWRSIGRRHLKDIGRVPLWALRRAADPVEVKSRRDRARADQAERRERVVERIAAGRPVGGDLSAEGAAGVGGRDGRGGPPVLPASGA